MLTVTNLDIRYGEKHLFNDVSARINDRDHIGLVGVNGAGKSTLLKIISGITETDPGVVRRPKRFSVAYLPQEATALDTGRTIYHEAESAFAGVLALQEELDEVNRQLAIPGPSDKGFEKLLKNRPNCSTGWKELISSGSGPRRKRFSWGWDLVWKILTVPAVP